MTRRRDVLALALAAAAAAGLRPAAAQGTASLDRIRQSGRLRIGVTSAEPWFFKDPMAGTWSGVGVDLGRQLASDLGVAMVPVETSWANCVAAIQADQIDVMFVLDPTEERRKAIDFPDSPLFYYAAGALVRPDQTATAWSDLDKSGTRIGVTLGTSVDRTVTETLKNASISRFSNNDEAVAAFAAKRVDAVAQFHPALVVQYARLKLGKVVLLKPVTPVATSAGIRRAADPAFKDWLSERFAALYAAGKPQEYFAAYLKTRGIDPATVPGLAREKWA
ncbi:transporter substrate-binding domain-containing protein [Methylobacterium platani]|uniref:Amino acid ABC transporter n=2 Tax=Methylobacterium platani TaxID=427683 RepID=A0A179S342_9HYPH|nr:transporter substrate-binding domain-containing protein [Methylobacterium platani]KMO19905.1 amino acid ABC transporter [Methylobacterium platani JCM 14648]OAS18083.1 amino acid ABC transporter [Methylobacterium platani]